MKHDKKNILEIIHGNKGVIRSFGVKKIGLFGSHARGEATSTSDIDLIIDLEKKTFDSYMDLKFFLEDLFQRKVDLVLIDAIKPRLKLTILKETVYAEEF